MFRSRTLKKVRKFSFTKKGRFSNFFAILILLTFGLNGLSLNTPSANIHLGNISFGNFPLANMAYADSETITAATPDQANSQGTNGYVLGLDISRYQHNSKKEIDFGKMYSSGVRFVYINGGNTLAAADQLAAKYYAADHQAANAAGLATGFYYFVHFPHTSSMQTLLTNADNQAKKVIDRINQNGGLTNLDLPVALDVETLCTTSLLKAFCLHSVSESFALNWILEFNKDIYNATNKAPLIYSYLSFVNRYFAKAPQLAAYPLWIATAGIDPNSHPLGPVSASNCGKNPWLIAPCQLNWSIWQYTSGTPGAKFGIYTGGVDTDLMKSNFFNFPVNSPQP
jgi:lysozyme